MSGSSPGAVPRAFLIPCWKLDRRCLVCEADRPGTGGTGSAGPAPPGTRLALGTRLGSPASVVSANTGARATSAACQPTSAGEDQAASSGSGSEAVRPTGRPPRRNQSDSTDSKIGRRLAGPVLSGGGITTSRPPRAGPGTAIPGLSAVPFADGTGRAVLSSVRDRAASPAPD